MKQEETKTVNVLLTVSENTDILIFDLDKEKPIKYYINLNSQSCQIEIKEIFVKLLEMLTESEIKLVFNVAEGYTKRLYTDVCTEYINELNKELKQVREKIRQVLK